MPNIPEEEFKSLLARLEKLEVQSKEDDTLYKPQEFPFRECRICLYDQKPVLRIKAFTDNKTNILMAKLTVKDVKNEVLVDMLQWYNDPKNKTKAKILQVTTKKEEIFPNFTGDEPVKVPMTTVNVLGNREYTGKYRQLTATIQKTTFLVELPDGSQFETDEIIAG